MEFAAVDHEYVVFFLVASKQGYPCVYVRG